MISPYYHWHSGLPPVQTHRLSQEFAAGSAVVDIAIRETNFHETSVRKHTWRQGTNNVLFGQNRGARGWLIPSIMIYLLLKGFEDFFKPLQ